MFFNNPIANFAQPIATGNNYFYNVVTDGLICYLDATNPASNSGGTSWFDLTDNGHTFTLYNGAAFGGSGADYGGAGAKYVYFDGTNDYALNSDVSLAEIGTFTQYTMQLILSWVTSVEEDTLSTAGIGNDGSYLFMAYNTNVRGHQWATGALIVQDTSGVPAYPTYTSAFQSINWTTGDFTSGTYASNATKSTTGTRPTSTTSTATSIGSRDGSGTGANGNFYLTALLMYNRKLTNTEIQQNANTYGLV